MLSTKSSLFSQELVVKVKKVLFDKNISFHYLLDYFLTLVASNDSRVMEIVDEAVMERYSKNSNTTRATNEEFLYKLIQDNRIKKGEDQQ